MFYNKITTSKKNTDSILDMMEVDDYNENQEIKRLTLLNLLHTITFYFC